MNVEKRPISQLTPAYYNPRRDLQPGDAEYEKIKNSIEAFGFVDPIIVNKDGTIIGGHQRWKVMRDLGAAEIDCVVLDLDKEHEKGLNIALNKISGDWDDEKLSKLLAELDGDMLALTGFDREELDAMLDEAGEMIENPYTSNVAAPHYEITGEKPNVSDLVNTEKAAELVNEIRLADVPKEIKDFLSLAAYRHHIFDYRKIAEFYAHSDRYVQELMERSALVIIDFDDAIKNGYARLQEEIAEMTVQDDDAIY